MTTTSTTAVVTGMLATAVITGIGVCIGWHIGSALISGTRKLLTASGNAMTGKQSDALTSVKELTEQIRTLNNGHKAQQTSAATA